MDDGKIPFVLLKKLSDQLLRFSQSVLLSYVEGNSTIKRGQDPAWLKELLDYNFTAIKEGSTILEMEAPPLKSVLKSLQLPIYQDFDPNEFNKKNSAIDLSMHVLNAAVNSQDSVILDKNLLKEIQKFKSLLTTETSGILIDGNKALEINRSSLAEIKVLEDKTPESIQAKVTGKLESIKHSKSQLEIISNTDKIRANLSESLKFDDVFPLFGKDITAKGIAHFNPTGRVSSFEIQKVDLASEKDEFFRQAPQLIFKEFDIKRLSSKSQYKGGKLSRILGKWPGDESTEEILDMLN